MSKQDIADFCDTHDACYLGKNWAVNNCESMHEVWLTARPDWLIWVATSPGVLPERDLRLFACWCARKVWHLLTDDRSKNAVIVAEKYARGEATREELACAEAEAAAAAVAEWGETWTAEWSAAKAAEAAAAAAEWSAARSAEWSAAAAAAAATEAEWAAAWAAETSEFAAAWAARWAAAAAEKAEREAQAEYLRERFNPFLKEGKK